MKELIFILEIIGTIAFAISGAIVAFEEKMDIFGVVTLGMTTAVAGGIIRDLILGNTPPVAFVEPVYALVAIVTALICFLKPVRNNLENNKIIIRLLDSIGLGIFTVVGATTAIDFCGDNTFLIVFTSILTGTGGGILRDIFAKRTPVIFVKHFYATASLCGGIFYYIIWKIIDINAATILASSLVVVLRQLAAKYHWELPK